MADIAAALAPALGSLFGGLGSLASTQAGVSAVGGLTEAGMAELQPYASQGMGYLNPINSQLLSADQGGSAASGVLGQDRINAPNPIDFEDFAKNYNTSEGAQYLMKTASEAQDSSAAAKGGLLSGANLRAQTGITEGIANQDLIQQYQSEAAGQQQNFQQQETSYQNMYGQEALGLQGAVAAAGTAAQGARAIGSLYGTQATNAQAAGNSFGSALGSVFTAISKL